MADARVDILLAIKSKLDGASETLAFLGKLGGGLSLAAIAYKAFSTAVESGKMANEIKNLAGQANMTTDAIQVLTVQGRDFNVTQEEIARTSVTLRKHLEEAAKDGASPLWDHLRALHLTAVGLQALAPERQFEIIGRRIAEAADHEAAFNAGMELLGAKNAPRLLEFLRELGTEGFDKFSDSAKALVISKADLDTLDRAANAWERIGYAMKVAGAKATVGTINTAHSAFGVDANTGLIQQQQLVWEFERKLADKQKNGVKRGDYTIEHTASVLKGAREEFAKMALLDGGEANIRQAIFWLKQYGNEFVDLQKKLESSVAKREERAAEVKKKMADAEMFPDLAAFTAERGRPGNHFEKLGQKLSGQDRALDQRIEQDMAAAVRAHAQEQERFAGSVKDSVDPLLKYRREIELVKDAEDAGRISKEESATRQRQINLQMQEAGGLLQGMDDRVSALRRQLELLDANRFLTDREKRAERVRMLQLENKAIDEQISKLKEFAALTGPEGDRYRREIRALEEKKTGNTVGIENGRELGAGDSMRAQLTTFQNGLGTIGENSAKLFTDPLQAGISTFREGLGSILLQGENWKQRWATIMKSIEGSFVQAGARMFTDWIANLIATKAKELGIFVGTETAKTGAVAAGAAARSGAVAAEAGAEMAVTGPAGVLRSIMELGPIAGPVVFVGALAALLALVGSIGKREAGGPVTAGMPYVVGEKRAELFVPDVSGTIIPRVGSYGAEGGGRRERLIMVVPDMVSARALARDPEFDNILVDGMKRNRGAIAS